MLVPMADAPTLADFLRARRERLSPADVGLPDSGRRRTPGLRREEVAALAGVSIDYLVRLEQGRDTNPSASVLLALADALQLGEDERRHLYKLTHVASAPEMCPTYQSPERDVGPTVRQLLDRLGAPAFVVGPFFDVLAWNASWEQLVGPIGLLDDRAEPNLARFTFLHPRARAAYPDWEASADEQAHGLRSVEVPFSREPRFQALLADLQEAPAFAERWSAHGVGAKRRRTKRVVHPTVGELRIAHEVLDLPDGNGQRVVVWLPADEATDDAIRRATVGESALRAV
jgi:transcriptional regulator with XRE-family HTH domain